MAYFAVHIPSPEGSASSVSGAVFSSLKEASEFASTPEIKEKGARFKRFTSPDDAKDYAEHGDVHSEKQTKLFTHAAAEPSVSFPPVSRSQLTRLKRAIETNEHSEFDALVRSNPRYLINVSGDTPSILAEGCRYNAMHIACKVGNIHAVEYILDFICKPASLSALYDTTKEDVKMRSNFLLDCYLNMPDKGAHETPLHFASKFGHINVVRALLGCKLCNNNPKNKIGLTPAEVCCTRYYGCDKEQVYAEMFPLFNAIYVSLYRPVDDYYCALIKPPVMDSGDNPIFHQPMDVDLYESPVRKPMLELSVLSAYAGPFVNMAVAQEFYSLLLRGERECRITLPRKGAERLGRQLSRQYGVQWMERWSFNENFIDLQSYSGLAELNRYLVNMRLHPPADSYRRLHLEGSKNADDQSLQFVDATEPLVSSDTMKDGGDGTSFGDRVTHLDVSLAKLDLDEVDGLFCGFEKFPTDGMLGRTFGKQQDSVLISNIGFSEYASDIEQYVTPPSSPEPVYIYNGIPSQEDEELIAALSLVDINLINRFGAVAEYLRQVLKIPENERARWPATDSPRVKKRRDI